MTWLLILALSLLLVELLVFVLRRRGFRLDLHDDRWARESVAHYREIRDLPPLPIFERRLRRPMPTPRPDSSANVFLSLGTLRAGVLANPAIVIDTSATEIEEL